MSLTCGCAQAMGEQGECTLAERVFLQLEAEALAAAVTQGADTLPQAFNPDNTANSAADAAPPAPLPGYTTGFLPGFEAGPRLDLGFSHFPSAWGPIVTPAASHAAAKSLSQGPTQQAMDGWQGAASQPQPISRGSAGAEAFAGPERAGSFGIMPTLLAEQVRPVCWFLDNTENPMT